jgi:hypothetical protein
MQFNLFATDNSFATSRGPGVCMAMSCDWVARSRALGGVTERRQLSSSFTWGIAQSAYEIGLIQGDLAIMERFNLTLRGQRRVQAAAHAMFSGGYMMLVISGRHGGHAMGIRNEPNHVEFFDPNQGAASLPSRVAFMAQVPYYIRQTYPHLLTRQIVYLV